ncbi:taste receptor type 1 member 1 [Colossoma macropomum]|uniref:taste receptor type 1 member 1 n=1 Tax=Colossoma macropomum TaxID=42526 RepID=UPI0018653F5D|nr:taste receptor type 1 member 1 [Colossoma macropomum]
MQWFAIYVFLLDVANWFKISCSASEFSLQGDYLLGGFFSLNIVLKPELQSYPVTLECHRYQFDESSYQMFQVMRFAVEEINNSTTLLPNVSLGYEIFNHCSDTLNFPSVFSFLSQNGSFPVLRNFNKYQPKVIAVTGPYDSTTTITVAPFFMMDLIPMVNYGSSSYDLSNKLLYPSFVRTVPSNKDLIDIIIRIIKWFRWNWVAFIGSQDDYSQDGLSLFYQYIRGNDICLAYQESLSFKSDYHATLKTIEKLKIKIIVVFSSEVIAENLIRAAINYNIRDKVWIAGEGWSMNKMLSHEPGIQNIGKIFGITEQFTSLPGFDKFINKTRKYSDDDEECSGCEGQSPQEKTCNQVCDNCTKLSSEEILNESTTFCFPVYAAIYSMAHALHNILHCDSSGCNKNVTVYPFMLLKEIKKLNFSLNGRQIKYDVNGDPPVSYAVVLWHPGTSSQVFEVVGTYDTYPEIAFTINSSLILWDNDGSVPFGNCSVECKEGFQREKDRNHDCCFRCKICSSNTYVNHTRDPYTCVPCSTDEWSQEGSIACQRREIMYLSFTDPLSVLLIASAASLVLLCIAITILFLYNYNTPVVKSAGGSMCFLMLVSLIMSSISLFFFFGQPTVIRCVFRNMMFCCFYSICLSCLTVRSFQIFCVFKMAAKFPEAYKRWVKHNGQWLVITIVSVFQFILCVLWVSATAPAPSRDESSYEDQIILGCSRGNIGIFLVVVFLIVLLSFLCFFFSYMCADLPKNYNEAKSITFSILFFYISWCLYFTANMISQAVYIQLLYAVAQLSSLYGIMLSYFIPKSYVVVFQPKKNTQAYFQTSIQNYTQNISRT